MADLLEPRDLTPVPAEGAPSPAKPKRAGAKPGANAGTKAGAKSKLVGGTAHKRPRAPTTIAPPLPMADSLPPAKPQKRHRLILASFLALVMAPILLTGAYLWVVAEDQYASTVAFSVRKEEAQSSLDILGGLSTIAGSATSDSDILYEFIHSQDMVATLDAELDLKAMWSKAWPADPVFAFNPEGTIEDLIEHWKSNVKLSYDAGTGLLTLRVTAFSAEDAQKIAQGIYGESSRMINALSAEATRDATRHASTERDLSLERLTSARQALTSFRLRTQIVDINSDLQGQMGLLNSLEGMLAEVQIERDLLTESAQTNDPRIRQADRRIEAIEQRIASERAKFGEGGVGPGGEDYARIAEEFERLTIEREFADATYRAALSAYDAALSTAQRQSRYLAAHISPTLAEKAQYPQRLTLFGLTAFFLMIFWSAGVLIYYSVRDRR